ncbi:uncharacterized protein L3040_005783 [Drepanopeziza brunnea f. sp. 'multigermtubi']|uniref:uncharacterized protein n=1 Tax=Drepanopeziza brunnea f. sp. 'multigermtubi' TaxID=698441 RepID=UPI00238C3E99|nr:hypothetical protein L3040_005783 [Drepanopeziza brunnea f. sp. 'multigermtubi']
MALNARAAEGSWKPVYLNLPLNTSASDDPIGFAKVSGFYGPGAWAALFLTLCSSWLNLVLHKRGFDASICSYLIALNAAAIDHLNHLRRLSALKAAADASWMQEAAPVGAAFTVTWWGLGGILAQIATSPLLYQRRSQRRSLAQRVGGLVLGSLVPSISIAAGIWLADREAGASIPMLYWRGMMMEAEPVGVDGKGHNTLNSHHDARIFASLTGLGFAILLGLAIVCVSGFWLDSKAPSLRVQLAAVLGPLWKVTDFLRRKFRSRKARIRGIVAIIVLDLGSLLAFVIGADESKERKHWQLLLLPSMLTVIPFVVILLIVGTPVMAPLHGTLYTMEYISAVSFHHGSSPSQSCWFMPCAPQSIAEMDQALALIGGLFSLLVLEIGWPFIKHQRRERREALLFEQEMWQNFASAQVDSTIQDLGNDDSNADTSGTSGARLDVSPAGASARDSGAPGSTRRFNPDILAQEARWRRQTTW